MLFSSARSRDFDGYIQALDFRCQCTQQKLQLKCAVLMFDPQLKKILTFFVKDRYNVSIKLFYLYQRHEYRDNYFFKIKFDFFLYLLLSVSWTENDLPIYISVIRHILGYRTSVFIQPFPWCFHISITYNLWERSFNLKGGYGFFLKKYSDSQYCWKKYSDFGGGKKNNLIQSFCHKI